MSTLKTHNLQSPDAGSVNIAMTPNAGMVVTGISTFTGNIDANGDLDVDGHTNLDNVSIAGITTVTGGELHLNRQGGLNAIEIGKGQNSDQYAYIDFCGDATYNDFGLRIIRNNTGANAKSKLQHRGTGDFLISSADSSSLSFETAGTERLRITSTGKVGINQSSNIQTRLHVSENIADSTSLNWANSTMSLTSEVGGNSTANRSTLYFAPYNSSNQYCPSAISCTAETNYQSTLKFFTNVAGNGTGHLESYERLRIDSSGHVLPGANNTYDLGSVAKGWRNVYMNDLNLSNMNGDTNDVDGTQGSWTIQEGKDDLYIINRLNGKKFKIKMEEIS